MQVLVISPHPDDEAIGCGGSIASHVSHGAKVYVIFLTSGENGGHGLSETETVRIREIEAQNAGKILKLAGLEFWNEPDGKFKANEKNDSR